MTAAMLEERSSTCRCHAIASHPAKPFSWQTKSLLLVSQTHAETWMLNFEETSIFDIPCARLAVGPKRASDSRRS
jgi:hypothetical protein